MFLVGRRIEPSEREVEVAQVGEPWTPKRQVESGSRQRGRGPRGSPGQAEGRGWLLPSSPGHSWGPQIARTCSTSLLRGIWSALSSEHLLMLFPLPEAPFHCLPPGNCSSSFRTSRWVTSSEKTPPTAGGCWLAPGHGVYSGLIRIATGLIYLKGCFLYLLCEALFVYCVHQRAQQRVPPPPPPQGALWGRRQWR